jgi:hypothetical protein
MGHRFTLLLLVAVVLCAGFVQADEGAKVAEQVRGADKATGRHFFAGRQSLQKSVAVGKWRMMPNED